ncbi:uncharacterized protein QC761_101130 [Podospora bellae-mahoneyi]|uniref:Uncharacterized protein n=1 Tax=Podospora bellae-mahoneyi TaxID=2093777 RepID=A0ABR0FUK1_9PEZI|nr:hypothetical protein QC761_101130 [Podospora bellae-mahoneyi]
MAAFSDPPPSIVPSHMLASPGFGFDSFDNDSDVELPQLPTPQALVPAHVSTGGQVGIQGNLSSNVIPIGSHTSGIVLYNDANLLGDGQQQLLYYSKNRADRDRNKQSRSEHRGGYSRTFSSDRATAYAIKTARYPVLYEMARTPAVARKALETWKRQPSQPSIPEGSNTSTGGQGQAGPSTAPVVRGATSITTALPPQHMAFSKPVLEKNRRGTRYVITCELEKAYPNFHIQCEYIYLNQQERVNHSWTDTRISLVNISTKENLWVVAMEQIGYNEAFIKGLVGDEEYAQLGSVDGPVKGHDKYSGPSFVAKVAKKITIPEGYDLGNIWCKAAGFYTMKIFVPSKEYKM